jgi:hypothetical protein
LEFFGETNEKKFVLLWVLEEEDKQYYSKNADQSFVAGLQDASTPS